MRAEALGEVAAGDVADALDPEREQHAAERLLARAPRSRASSLSARHLAEALELDDLLAGQPVEVGGRPARAPAAAARATCFSPRPSMSMIAGERLQQLPAALGAVAVRAPREDRPSSLTVGVSQNGQRSGGRGGRRAVGVLERVRRGREHLRDHVAGAQHDHLVARADVLAREVLLVVQRRHLDRDAADVDRLERARTGAGRRTCRRSRGSR